MIELIVTNNVVLHGIYYLLFLKTSEHVTHVIGKLQFCRGASGPAVGLLKSNPKIEGW